MTSLFELTNKLQQLVWTIEDNDGELDEELEKQLDELEEEIPVKCERILKVIEDSTAKAAVLKERAKVIQDQAKSLEKLSERLKTYVRDCLVSANMDKCPTPDFPKLGLRKNPPKALVDEENLDEKWKEMKVKYVPAKKKILEALKVGVEIKGAQLAPESKRVQWK